jgi:glycosyltransferase involved in cell wall biosynthesis
MKIALISPPLLKTPPTGYGGLEKVVYDLGTSLVKKGHEVTLFAPPGSHIDGATLFETVTAPERTDVDWVELECNAFNIYKRNLNGFDIIHDNTWFGFSYLARYDQTMKGVKICHTHHGHLNWDAHKKSPDVGNICLVAISRFMADEFRKSGWESKYVYNGVDIEKQSPVYEKSDRLVFVGRIDKIKGTHIAIKVAIETNTPIDIVGGSFVNDKQYLEAIKAECANSKGIATLHLDAPDNVKIALVQSAKACLIPSQFGEPFGLTAVEALACGTPVIAYDDGALKEIINAPDIGTICAGYDVFLESVRNIKTTSYDYKKCRTRSEYFSCDQMADRYLKLYKEVIDGEGW